jgi:hypothetical protein
MNKEQIAFEKIMGDVTMPDNNAPEYDWWLFNKAWQARAALDKQDTFEIVAELDYELTSSHSCDVIVLERLLNLLTKMRKHLTGK